MAWPAREATTTAVAAELVPVSVVPMVAAVDPFPVKITQSHVLQESVLPLRLVTYRQSFFVLF